LIRLTGIDAKSTHCAIPEPALACGWLVVMSTSAEPDVGELLMSAVTRVGAAPLPVGSGADDKNCAHGASGIGSKFWLGAMFCADTGAMTNIDNNNIWIPAAAAGRMMLPPKQAQEEFLARAEA
jgi:hypothetical protein